MAGPHPEPRYLSYLLRLWQTRDGERWVWRASLQTPGLARRRGFASVQELVDFLHAETGQVRQGEEGGESM